MEYTPIVVPPRWEFSRGDIALQVELGLEAMRHPSPADYHQFLNVLKTDASSLERTTQRMLDFVKMIRNELSCEKCLRTMTNPCTLLSCGHSFCHECTLDMMRGEGFYLCVECSSSSADFAFSRALDTLISKWHVLMATADDLQQNAHHTHSWMLERYPSHMNVTLPSTSSASTPPGDTHPHSPTD